jgi:hypothetical protein
MDVSVEWGCGNSGVRVWDGKLEVYNGELMSLNPLGPKSKVEVLTENSWRSRVETDRTDGIKVAIWYAHNYKADSFDETVVTIRSKAFSFSFSVKDLERGEAILIKE